MPCQTNSETPLSPYLTLHLHTNQPKPRTENRWRPDHIFGNRNQFQNIVKNTISKTNTHFAFIQTKFSHLTIRFFSPQSRKVCCMLNMLTIYRCCAFDNRNSQHVRTLRGHTSTTMHSPLSRCARQTSVMIILHTVNAVSMSQFHGHQRIPMLRVMFVLSSWNTRNNTQSQYIYVYAYIWKGAQSYTGAGEFIGVFACVRAQLFRFDVFFIRKCITCICGASMLRV